MQDNNKTELKLHYILGFAILAAAFLDNMCRRAEGAVLGITPVAAAPSRVDIIGDIDLGTALLTPMDIAKAGPNLTLFIDSPGGLMNGYRAVARALDARRLRGYKTTCSAFNASSAAFFILMKCDERVVAPYGKFLVHYSYIIADKVTVSNYQEYTSIIESSKLEVDMLLDAVFNVRAPQMRQHLLEEKTFSGRELCNTFVGFCHVSYIFPILEGKQ